MSVPDTRTKPIRSILSKPSNGQSKIVQSNQTPTKSPKYRKNTQSNTNSNQSSSVSNNHTANTLSRVRINIPKPELKVSNYSKITRKSSTEQSNNKVSAYGSSKPPIARSASEIDFTEMHSPAYREAKMKLMPSNSYSTDYVNHINAAESVDSLKYQQTKIEKIPRPLPRVPFATPQILQPIPQHHRVVDVVPKPPRQPPIEWNIPDQTIGIPITNATPILDFHNLTSTNDSTHHYPRQTVLMPTHMQIASQPISLPSHPMLIRTKSMNNISLNSPPIIHHPLVSGHIPPSVHSTENYLIKKQIPLDGPPLPLPPKPPRQNASSSILSSTTQQNLHPKKENGEKNKVKFSDTVTVAMVPVR